MEIFGKKEMNCDQVEAIVLDLDLSNGMDSRERSAALAHLSYCSRCAALLESWQTAKEDLVLLSEEALEAHAPARVEMRLRQEFRTRHRTMVARRASLVAAWALAAAAVLVGAVSWWNWKQTRPVTAGNGETTAVGIGATSQNQYPGDGGAAASSADDSSDFTPLPGAMADDAEEASILRVRMQRGSLGVLGLPVNEERAGEWIQVDLLVSDDGLPQAVRLAPEEN